MMTAEIARLLAVAEAIALTPVKVHWFGGNYAEVPNDTIKELREAILAYYRRKP